MQRIEVERRTQSARSLRREGKVPGVMYGPGVKEAVSVVVERRAFEQLLRHVSSSDLVIVDGVGDGVQALIQDVQYHPVTEEPLHVDLYAVSATEEVEVEVPLVFRGEAPAEKLGGVLTKVRHEVRVAALPAVIPHELYVDVSQLRSFDDRITAGNISLPQGVRLLTDPGEVVAVVVPEEEEDLSAPPEEVDVNAIALAEERGKRATEGSSEEEATS